MSSFTSMGAAGGGADALQEILRRRFEEQQSMRDYNLRKQDMELRRQTQQDNLTRQAENDKYLREERQAQTEARNAAVARQTERDNYLAGLAKDPTAFNAMTPAQRIVGLARYGVNNLSVHDLETPQEHGAHLKTDQDVKFSEWQRQHDYTVAHPLRQPADPVATFLARQEARATMDDPALPRGVQDYIAQISARNPDFTSGRAEFVNAIPSLRRDHPNLSAERAIDALHKAYGTVRNGAAGSPDDALVANVLGGASGGAAAQRPVRIVSANGQPVRQGPGAIQGADRMRDAARSVIKQKLGRDASDEDVDRFLASPRNRQLLGGK